MSTSSPDLALHLITDISETELLNIRWDLQGIISGILKN
jgi:hypothetical protein